MIIGKFITLKVTYILIFEVGGLCAREDITFGWLQMRHTKNVSNYFFFKRVPDTPKDKHPSSTYGRI